MKTHMSTFLAVCNNFFKHCAREYLIIIVVPIFEKLLRDYREVLEFQFHDHPGVSLAVHHHQVEGTRSLQLVAAGPQHLPAQSGRVPHLLSIVVPHHHALDQFRHQRPARPRQVRSTHLALLGILWAQAARLDQFGL